MRDSQYSALFGAMSNEIRMAQIANNLANVNTTAYKKDGCTFHDTFLHYAHDYLPDTKPYIRDKELWPPAKLMSRPRLSDQTVDFSQGSIVPTGNDLDVAINGEGFFTVQDGNGNQYFTRNGRFQISTDNQLVTEQGFLVMGDGGPITIPPGNRVIIDNDGVVLTQQGERNAAEPVGRLQLSTVNNLAELEKIGEGLFQFQPGSTGGEAPVDNPAVSQGFLEGSNVNIVTEMVSMIDTQRCFQIYQKMISGTDDLDKMVITRVGRAT